MLKIKIRPVLGLFLTVLSLTCCWAGASVTSSLSKKNKTRTHKKVMRQKYATPTGERVRARFYTYTRLKNTTATTERSTGWRPTQNGRCLKGVFLRVDFGYEFLNIRKILATVTQDKVKKTKKGNGILIIPHFPTPPPEKKKVMSVKRVSS